MSHAAKTRCPKRDRQGGTKLVEKCLEKGEVTLMLPSYDIFKIDSGGSVLWRGAVESFEAAKACIQELALSSPGEYLVLDQHTGHKVCVVVPDVATRTNSLEEVRATAGA